MRPSERPATAHYLGSLFGWHFLEALAEKLGLNVSTVVAWERDRVRKLFPKVRRRFEAFLAEG